MERLREARVAHARRNARWCELEESRLVPRSPGYFVDAETDLTYKRWTGGRLCHRRGQLRVCRIQPSQVYFVVDSDGARLDPASVRASEPHCRFWPRVGHAAEPSATPSRVKPGSGRRGSNPRHLAWEASALPTELRPRDLDSSRVVCLGLSRPTPTQRQVVGPRARH
jgi:hypothetical protein